MPPSDRLATSAALHGLGEGFFDEVVPARFPQARVRVRNQGWAERIGLGELTGAEWIGCFARFEPLPGSLGRPLALRYHGHQFQAYNPGLGDGRGFVYAQLRDPVDGRLLDLGTKGSGRTPWSRGGDGKLTLKGGVREALATEMLEALGVYTSRTLSLIETGEELHRGDEPSPTRSSVLVRLSHGHVRFGSFQLHAHAGDKTRLRRLLDYTVEHHFPGLARGPQDELPARFLGEVARRCAALVASWMAAGFVHGVLNTDNINVTGESFDYGPYRFLPRYDEGFVAAYFDERGLYAYGRQPAVLLWNLQRLAESLEPLCPAERLRAELVDFAPRAMQLYHRRFVERLGLETSDPSSDAALVSRCVCFLAGSGAGYARFFFDWYGGQASEARARAGPGAPAYVGPKWEAARASLFERRPTHPERLTDPYFDGQGPCDLPIDELEALWSAISGRDDWDPFEAKLASMRALGRLMGYGPAQPQPPAGADGRM